MILGELVGLYEETLLAIARDHVKATAVGISAPSSVLWEFLKEREVEMEMPEKVAEAVSTLREILDEHYNE